MAVERNPTATHLGDQLQRLAQLLVAAALADHGGVPAIRLTDSADSSCQTPQQVEEGLTAWVPGYIEQGQIMPLMIWLNA